MKLDKKKSIVRLRRKVRHLSNIKLEKLLIVLAARYNNKSLDEDVEHYFKVGGSI